VVAAALILLYNGSAVILPDGRSGMILKRKYLYILKFAASSMIGFVADYSLYGLFVLLTKGLGGFSVPVSNVAARVLSAWLNFWINKRFVFKNEDQALKAGAKYALLATSVLAGNTALLSLLVRLGMNKYWAKLLTEVTFFASSWFVQKVFVFKKRPHRDRAGASGEPLEE
jgi:putative flippase GtrA